MNRNRRPLPNKIRKEMEKQIKKGQKNLIVDEMPRTDSLTPKAALKKYPVKRQKVEHPLVDTLVREMKKKKKKTKNSKRTTPGEVPHRESSPAHPHTENERWQQTLKKQSINKEKSLTSKLQKRNQKKK